MPCGLESTRTAQALDDRLSVDSVAALLGMFISCPDSCLPASHSRLHAAAASLNAVCASW